MLIPRHNLWRKTFSGGPSALRIALALCAALAVLTAAVMAGSSGVTARDIGLILAHKLFGYTLPGRISAAQITIIWTLRLPRVLVAFTVGGALAVSGCVVQSVLKNPLATPYTLGVSSGASLAAGLVIVFNFTLPLAGAATLPVAGFAGALATVAAVLLFSARVDRSLSNMTVILAGMVFSLFFSAVLTVITALAQEHIERITLWQMGSFSMRGWSYLGMLTPFFILGTVCVLLCGRELDILTFGEESAGAIGVDTVRVKRIVFLCAAVLTGSSVAVCGTIGFVDLVAPHLVRRWFGPRHCAAIPMCVVVGGTLMVLADLAARTILSPSELPVGAVTALIGAPFFVWIYFKRMK